MAASLTDYFAFDTLGSSPLPGLGSPWLGVLAWLFSAGATYAAFGLGGRAARTRVSQRWLWRMLAAALLAVAVVGPVWLVTAARQPALLPNLGAALLALLTGFAAALGALLVSAGDGPERRLAASLAAALLAVAIAAGNFISLADAAPGIALALDPAYWSAAWLAALLTAALSLHLARFGRPLRMQAPAPAVLPAALVFAAGVLGTHLTGLAGARLVDVPNFIVGGQRGWIELVLPLLGLAVLLAVVLVRLFERRGDRSLLDYRARLRRELRADPITGLPTAQVLGESFLRLQRAALLARAGLAVAVVKLTGLDRVLASHGAAERDQIYSLAAWRLRGLRGEDELLGVLGDERFVLVLRVADAAQAASRLRDAIELFETPLRDEGVQIRVRPQIGISLWPSQGEHFDRLLSNALVALERSRPGTAQVYLAAHREETERRSRIEAELAEALANSELTAVFQPVLDLRSGRIGAVEMLARWYSPTIGDVSPEQFVLIAETSGQIHAFDRWLLREAIATVKWLDAAGFPRLRIAVNVSPLNLADPEFPDFVHDLLAGTTIDPARLEIEITEAAIAEGERTVFESLLRLRSFGLVLTIDDFGVGHSSLARLRDLPVGRLKIDRSFIRDADHRQGEQMLGGIVGLAHGLGLEVVAEGIESDAQRQLLAELGCEYLQGFLISRPLSWRGLLDFLGEPHAGHGTAQQPDVA